MAKTSSGAAASSTPSPTSPAGLAADASGPAGPDVAPDVSDSPVQQSMANDGEPVVTFEGPGAQVTVASDPTATGDGSQRPACVVNSGEGFHVGRAVPGSMVCSYHAMHYDNNGRPRAENAPDNAEYVGTAGMVNTGGEVGDRE